MARRQDSLRLSVISDLDGMTVGALRQLLEGISDDTEIQVEEEESPDYRSDSVDTFYQVVIRKG